MGQGNLLGFLLVTCVIPYAGTTLSQSNSSVNLSPYSIVMSSRIMGQDSW